MLKEASGQLLGLAEIGGALNSSGEANFNASGVVLAIQGGLGHICGLSFLSLSVSFCTGAFSV